MCQEDLKLGYYSKGPKKVFGIISCLSARRSGNGTKSHERGEGLLVKGGGGGHKIVGIGHGGRGGV